MSSGSFNKFTPFYRILDVVVYNGTSRNIPVHTFYFRRDRFGSQVESFQHIRVGFDLHKSIFLAVELDIGHTFQF